MLQAIGEANERTTGITKPCTEVAGRPRSYGNFFGGHSVMVAVRRNKNGQTAT
jgi:hypothetical protein